jgi:RNA polymerase sigma-70 factor (sigma-E family)
VSVADEEFDAFVQRVGPRLLRAAWLLAGDWPSAEDLVQTAFERTWPRWARLREDDQRAAYLHRVMTNAFLRSRRWTGEIPTDELPEPAALDGMSGAPLRRALLGAVRSLPARQRAVIALRYLVDLTEVDTAAALGCSVGTVKSYTARAFAGLRSCDELADLLIGDARP